LDQPAGQQQRLAEGVAAVAVAGAVAFARQVEGPPGLRPGDQVERSLVVAVVIGAGPVQCGPAAIDRRQQRLPAAQPAALGAGGAGEGGNTRGAGVVADEQGVVPATQETGKEAGEDVVVG